MTIFKEVFVDMKKFCEPIEMEIDYSAQVIDPRLVVFGTKQVPTCIVEIMNSLIYDNLSQKRFSIYYKTVIAQIAKKLEIDEKRSTDLFNFYLEDIKTWYTNRNWNINEISDLCFAFSNPF